VEEIIFKLETDYVLLVMFVIKEHKLQYHENQENIDQTLE